MSARVYFMITVNGCKDVSKCLRKINSEDGQVCSVCILQYSCFTKYNRKQSKHKQTKCELSVSIMSLQDEQTDKFTLFVYCNFHVLLSTTVYSQNINKQNVKIAGKTLTNYSFSVGITILNQRII